MFPRSAGRTHSPALPRPVQDPGCSILGAHSSSCPRGFFFFLLLLCLNNIISILVALTKLLGLDLITSVHLKDFRFYFVMGGCCLRREKITCLCELLTVQHNLPCAVVGGGSPHLGNGAALGLLGVASRLQSVLSFAHTPTHEEGPGQASCAVWKSRN